MNETDALCRKIAQALDITPTELRAIQATKERAAKLQDAIEILEAFQELPDQPSRRRCIGFVKAEVLRHTLALHE